MQDIIQTVKSAVGNRWADVLSKYFDPTTFDRRKGHPCPKCSRDSNDDRFGVFKDFEATGGVTCRKCFAEGSDGIASVAWLLGCSQIEAAKRIALDIGLDVDSPDVRTITVDVIDSICRAKRMPREGLEPFGPLLAWKYGRENIDAIKVPVYNERGEQHSFFYVTAVGKGYCQRGKGMDGLFFPGRLPKAGESWLVTEGVKDAAALTQLGYLVCGLPTCLMAAKYAKLFAGCNVVLVPDLDVPSMEGTVKSGGHLFRLAASIRVARMPGEVVQSKGDGVREVLAKRGVEAVREAVAKSEPWEPAEGTVDDRPAVAVTLNEGVVAEQVIGHLARLGAETPWIPKRLRDDVSLFQRGGMLVQTLESDADEQLENGIVLKKGLRRIRELPEPLLRERVTQCCRLTEDRSTETDIKIVPVVPPKWLVSAIHVRGHYPKIRSLVGCVDTPVLRTDGSVLETPGYDAATRLLYEPRMDFPAIGSTFEEAEAAASELAEVVVDFPFVSSADRSAWLALLLTLVGRSCVTGCCPLFAVSANVRGAGKTILLNTAHIIARGSKIAARAYEHDDREMKKAITAIAIEAIPAVMLDNIAGRLGGASLDAVLTSTVWTDRILGESRTTGDLPIKTVWTATGNNLSYGGDLGRRVLPLRLTTPEEKPEDRTEFRHKDLFGWIEANRARLVVAALTILRAYILAGKPDQGGTWGSFESWHRIIRGAVYWVGWDDPMQTRLSIDDSDDTASLLRLLIHGLNECDPYKSGKTTKELGVLSAEDGMYPSLAEAVSMVCGGKFDALRFARKLKQFANRVVAEESIVAVKGHSGLCRWYVKVNGVPLPERSDSRQQSLELQP
jgi:hypothetical protein